MSRFMQRFGFVFMLAVVVATLAGCSFLDALFGYDATKPDGGASNPSPLTAVGGLLSVLFPWGAGVSLLTGAVRWLYVEIRSGQTKSAVPSVLLGVINAVKSAKGGQIDTDKLYSTLQGASVLYSNKDAFAKFVADVQKAWALETAKGANPNDIAAITKDIEADIAQIEAMPAPGAAAAAPAPAPAPTPAAPAAPSTPSA